MYEELVVEHSSAVSSRTFDGDAVIVDSSANVVRMLNKVGSRIWELINGERTVSDIAEILTSEYDVTLEEATESVVDFFRDLEARQLIIRQSGAARE